MIVSTSNYNAHIETIFKTDKHLNVNDILSLQEHNFYYKYEHNKLPYYLPDVPLKINSSIYSHAIGTQHIHLLKPNHEYAKNCNIIAKIYTHNLHDFFWIYKTTSYSHIRRFAQL